MDYSAIGEIARSAGNTEAGETATLLLGRKHLADGKFVEALLLFQRLASSEHAAERFGDELKLLHATSLNLVGDTEDAKKILSETKISQDNPLAKNWDPENPTSLLDAAPQSTREQLAIQDWRLFAGNRQRNGRVQASMPVGSHFAWDIALTDETEQKKLSNYAKKMQPTGTTPVLHPLLVGDWVIARSTDYLYGIKLEPGKRQWFFPSWENNDSRRDLVSAARRETLIQQRVWQSGLFGHVSCDGEQIYLLSSLPDGVTPRRVTQGVSNELVALSLKREGSLSWSVGLEEERHEPQLKGMFFLGPPLPLGDSLFCVGERNNEIRVMELDRKSGKLLWSQQLAHVEVNTRYGYSSDQLRRLSGLNLAYADGVLLCPTSVGGVIAIELAQRRLMWGYEYKPQSNNARRRPSMPSSRWRDAWVTVDNGKVILTPWDSGNMYCLDLLTGESVWKQPIPLGTNLFVAGVHDDKVVVVGRDAVKAYGIEDAATKWSLPLRSTPSGRGILTDSTYLLATNNAEMLEIDLNKGKVNKSVPTIEPLGNLIASQDMIISQNATWIRAFYQRDKLEAKIEASLARNSNDPWALEHAGILQLEDGDRMGGIKKLRSAIANYQIPGRAKRAKDRLVDTCFELLLEVDDPEVLEVARSIEPFLPNQQRREEYLRVMTIRNRKAGHILEAFESNLKLFAASLSKADWELEKPMIQLDQANIRTDRWHRSMFYELWRDATPTQREQMRKQVAQQLEIFKSQKNWDAIRWDALSTMQDLPVAQLEYLAAVQLRLNTDGKPPYLEGALLRLSRSENQEVAGTATMLLAQLYSKSGQMKAASVQYTRLQTEFAEQQFAGQTGQQLAETARQKDASLASYLSSSYPWGLGLVEATQKPPSTPATPRVTAYQPYGTFTNFLDLDSDHGPDFGLGIEWVMEQVGRSLSVSALDPFGESVAKLGPVFQNSGRGREPRIRTYGHLVVGALGDGLIALNGLRRSNDLTSSEMWSKSGSGSWYPSLANSND